MKATIMITLFLIASITGYAQENETTIVPTDTSYTAMREKLKSLYIKKKNSDSYAEMSKRSKRFVFKMKSKVNKENFKDDTFMKEWLRDNIAQTSFKSYEAAIEEWEELKAASGIVVKENQELNTYLFDATQIHGTKIFVEVAREVEMEYMGLGN